MFLRLSEIMRYCHAEKIPVTPAGARTGLSGGSLPIHGGVLLSMEKFNKILKIDEKNHQVITEPGVITQVLQDTVKEKGLFYPCTCRCYWNFFCMTITHNLRYF
ncbi:MAG: FAD-binding oxidoreductase [Crocinitomicaceae bacterium]|nr:FAD-binding oxidoreductase [Crocinitomicaceae bacterium]